MTAIKGTHRRLPLAVLGRGTVLVLACLLSLAAAKSAPAFSSIIVFGDSYQDNGNVLSLSATAVAAGIPGARRQPAAADDPTFWQGRWSNGPTMVEVLAQRRGLPLSDFAVSGAKSTYGNYDAWLDYVADTGLLGQIDSFEQSLTDAGAPPDALYIVSFSTNDYCQFHDFHQHGRLPVGQDGTISYEALATRVARNVRIGVERLITLGARHIVVFSSYPIDQSPLATLTDPQVPESKRFTRRFDDELAREIHRVNAQYHGGARGAKIEIFPIGDRMRSIIDRPADFGLSDVSHPCLVTTLNSEVRCALPEKFLWWDSLHPTARAHEILGEMLLDSLVKAVFR